MLPSAVATASAPATSRISWLNPTPQMITVYASPWSSPSPTQHSLPSGRYPLAGPDFHRLDPASFAWRTATPSSQWPCTRFSGDDVRFLAGTDENSIKNVQAADRAGVPVAELVERSATRFHALKEKPRPVLRRLHPDQCGHAPSARGARAWRAVEP